MNTVALNGQGFGERFQLQIERLNRGPILKLRNGSNI